MGEEYMLAVQEVELFVLLPIPAVGEVELLLQQELVVGAEVYMMNTTELLLV
jgi:hypothetical protein